MGTENQDNIGKLRAKLSELLEHYASLFDLATATPQVADYLANDLMDFISAHSHQLNKVPLFQGIAFVLVSSTKIAKTKDTEHYDLSAKTLRLWAKAVELRWEEKDTFILQAGMAAGMMLEVSNEKDAARGFAFSKHIKKDSRKPGTPRKKNSDLKNSTIDAYNEWRKEAGINAPVSDFFEYIGNGGKEGLECDLERIWFTGDSAGDGNTKTGVSTRAVRDWLKLTK